MERRGADWDVGNRDVNLVGNWVMVEVLYLERIIARNVMLIS